MTEGYKFDTIRLYKILMYPYTFIAWEFPYKLAIWSELVTQFMWFRRPQDSRTLALLGILYRALQSSKCMHLIEITLWRSQLLCRLLIHMYTLSAFSGFLAYNIICRKTIWTSVGFLRVFSTENQVSAWIILYLVQCLGWLLHTVNCMQHGRLVVPHQHEFLLQDVAQIESAVTIINIKLLPVWYQYNNVDLER